VGRRSIWPFGYVQISIFGGGIMKTKDLIAEAISLPVEERAMVVDSILKSLNPTESDIDKKWAAVAKQRLKELRSGEVEAIPGDDVFQRIWKRFAS
jgi:putative addiction module component (TIGR02574 family)